MQTAHWGSQAYPRINELYPPQDFTPHQDFTLSPQDFTSLEKNMLLEGMGISFNSYIPSP
jgi:hypothetical protein